jgi:hypothetical protein
LSPGLQLHIRNLFYEARISFYEGRQIEEAEDHNEEFKKKKKKKLESVNVSPQTVHKWRTKLS